MRLGNIEEEDIGFQIAPLIDIFFLVLIFFMTSSIFFQMEAELPLNLPLAEDSLYLPRTPGKIIINVDKNGKIIVNQKVYTLTKLKELLERIVALFPNQAIIIRGDREVNYGRIVEVLDICAKVGIWNVSFATLKKEEKK